MKNFNKGKGSGDFPRKGVKSSAGRGFGRGASTSRSFSRDDRDADRPEMHQATCAECGNSCEVPFKPISGRPILCSHCFKGKDGQDSKRPNSRSFAKPFDRRDSAPRTNVSNNISSEQFEILNAKLDQILKTLE